MALVQMLLILMTMAALHHLGEFQAESPTSSSRKFAIANDTFLKDGTPFRILGGELHYFRIVPEYWSDRIMRAKSMGLNTIQTYIPWNVHEPFQGKFVFTGAVDVEAFLKLAQELDVLVMLRIGPYVCGEWDLGGFPSWLLSKQLKLRTSDSVYLDLVDQWWNVLLPKISPFLYARGGPVIMIQIENEYGSYGRDKLYLHHLSVQARKHLGEDIILFTTDGATDEALQGGTIVGDDVYAAVDYPTGWDPVAAFLLQKKYNINGKSPPLSAEFYTGWLTHWGENLARTSPTVAAMELDRLLSANGSVVLYMAHGGSNFGFFSGANTGGKEALYQPDITSYDYDAPIGEGGDLGEKFWRFRQVLSRYVTSALPDPPAVPARKNSETIMSQRIAYLFEVLNILSDEVHLQVPAAMEYLNQSYGFVVYRSQLPAHAKPGSILTITKVHDRAQVYIGQNLRALELVGIIERWSNYSSLQLPYGSVTGLEIYIMVENMGRVNYGPFIHDFKGILSSVVLDRVPMVAWRAYPLSLANAFEKLESLQIIRSGLEHQPRIINSRVPAFYTGTFESSAHADTFISFRGWSKGVAFVNGFNLGRFWPDAGPQCSLYVPGPLLKDGENKLLILELEDTDDLNKTLQFAGEHDWSCNKKNT